MESNAGYSQRFNSYCSFESNLRQYEVDTTSKFIVQRKDKDFGVYHTITEPRPACYHVHWESKHIPFDGTPYIVVGRKGYDCHQGPDRHERHKSRQQELLNDHTDHLGLHKERRRLVQDTKKLGCPAAILVVHVTRFPEYKIDEDSPKLRRKKAGELKVALATNQPVVQEQQFIGSFPPVEEHRNHPRTTGNPSSSPPPETRETGDPSSTEMTKQSKTKKRQKCGSLLREISDLAYHLQDESFLDSVIGCLTDLLEDVRAHTPHDETLPLSYTPPSKKARHLKSLSMVPKKHPFSGRVGRRAEAMRSSSSFKLTNLPPSTHLPSDHSQSTTTVQSLAVAEGVLSNMPASVSSPDVYQSQTTEATTALSPLKSIKSVETVGTVAVGVPQYRSIIPLTSQPNVQQIQVPGSGFQYIQLLTTSTGGSIQHTGSLESNASSKQPAKNVVVNTGAIRMSIPIIPARTTKQAVPKPLMLAAQVVNTSQSEKHLLMPTTSHTLPNRSKQPLSTVLTATPGRGNMSYPVLSTQYITQGTHDVVVLNQTSNPVYQALNPHQDTAYQALNPHQDTAYQALNPQTRS